MTISAFLLAAVITHIQADMKSKDGGGSSLTTKLLFDDAQTRVMQLGSGELRITLKARTAEGLRYVIEYLEDGKLLSKQDMTLAPGEPAGISSVGPTRELSVLLTPGS